MDGRQHEGLLDTLSVGFTGTQVGMTSRQFNTLEGHMNKWSDTYSRLEIHHGDCIGADREFHEFLCTNWPGNLIVVIHPPINESKRAFCSYKNLVTMKARDYLERNKDIVKASSRMIAAPKEPVEQLRSGTWSTVRFARKNGVPGIILNP